MNDDKDQRRNDLQGCPPGSAISAAEGAICSAARAAGSLQKFVQTVGFDPFKAREQEFFENLMEAVLDLKSRDCKFRGNPPPDSEMISPPSSEN